MPTTVVDLAPVIRRYVLLRDHKSELKKAFEESVASIDAGLDKIENFLLKQLSEQGSESIKTPFGTAYISVKTNVSIKDAEVFKAFARAQPDPFAFFDNKANKTAVEEYSKEHNDVPPGIGVTKFQTVNIRRS